MKKTISLFFALACIFSLSAKTIYLNTGGSSLWGTNSPEFFIHAWGAGDTDVYMTLLEGDIYQAEIPDGSTSCIFTRQKTSSTTIIWDYNNGLLNRTGDETIGSNNCFTITGWGSGYQANCTGSWSTYTPTYTPTIKRIYCKMTQGWWTASNAAVGIYCFKGTVKNALWPGLRMTAVSGEEGLWYADVDVKKYTSVVFSRVNGSGTVSDLKAQTIDLTIPTDEKNCYTITTATAPTGTGKCSGTWSTYTPPTYYITGNDKLVGTDKAWDVQAIKLGTASTETPATYTFTTLPADTCKLLITNGTENVKYGYSALDTENSSANILTDNEDNIVFVPTEANKEVVLTFDGTKVTLKGDFAAPAPVVNNITMYCVNTMGWTNVYAYISTGETNKIAWPGEAMTKTTLTKNGFDVYSYEFPETYTSITFSDGTGGDSNQTGNLTIDINKPYFYNGTWYTTLDDICTTEYGVMVNGTNYTAATISQDNTAEYKLTGLKLTKDDTFTLYNACTDEAWVITTFKEGSTSNITIADNKYVAGATGSYDICFELNNEIYISYTPTTPTEIINANTVLDVNAPIYNLLGVQVDSNYKGVVIQNGKKFIQK